MVKTLGMIMKKYNTPDSYYEDTSSHQPDQLTQTGYTKNVLVGRVNLGYLSVEIYSLQIFNKTLFASKIQTTISTLYNVISLKLDQIDYALYNNM